MTIKSLNINLLFVCILLSISNSIFAYTWNYKNNTAETMVLRFGLSGMPGWYYHIIQPGDTQSFSWKAGSWPAGYCLWGAEWARYDPTMKKEHITQNGGLDLYTTSGDQKDLDGAKFSQLDYAYKTLEIVRESSSQPGTGRFHEMRGTHCCSLDFVIQGIGESIKTSSGKEINGPYAMTKRHCL